MVTQTPQPKVEITTIPKGAVIEISTRSKSVDGYIGDVLDVDAVAIRHACRGHHIADIKGWFPEKTVRVIPWLQVEDIEIHQPKPRGARS